MSANIIFNVPGHTTNYMPISLNASKEEILDKYARLKQGDTNLLP